MCSELVSSVDASRGRPSLQLLFVSPDYIEQLPELLTSLANEVDTRRLIGCTGAGIVTGGHELEDQPCVVLWSAWLPGDVQIEHVTFESSTEGPRFHGVSALDDRLATWLLLSEPFSFPTDVFLERINEQCSSTSVVGGVASGHFGPQDAKLVWQDRVLETGALVAKIEAPTTSFVSQGCRPIGHPMIITKAEQNEIFELGGKNALEQLQAIHRRLPNRDQALMQQGLQIGRVTNEYQADFEYGDFLIRNVSGIREEDGSILVGDYVRVGQTVQFHLRDASTADQDLKQMLARVPAADRVGALLFTCSGRGTRFFEEPDHDAQLVSQSGQIPTAGFFCAGEVGPVGGRNFLHGYSAAVLFF